HQVSLLRLGVILSRYGGLLSELEPLYKNGLGGRLGSGKQWMSWIHLEDVVGLIHHLLLHPYDGPINGVSPKPIQQGEFAKAFAKALGSRLGPAIPSFSVRALLGERAQLALASQRVLPEVILNKVQYQFHFEDLENTLKNIYFYKSQNKLNEIFETQQWVTESVEKVFPFFSNEKNLEKITPPSLSFKVLEKNTKIVEEGTKITYQLKLHGIPFKWKSIISSCEPRKKFVDEQESGPYRYWHHTHGFQSVAGGTLLTDQVIYRPPLGALGSWLSGSLIKRKIQKIFSYREK